MVRYKKNKRIESFAGLRNKNNLLFWRIWWGRCFEHTVRINEGDTQDSQFSTYSLKSGKEKKIALYCTIICYRDISNNDEYII